MDFVVKRFVFVSQDAAVLHVALSHVTLTLDSVAVNQESLDHAVTTVR